MNEQANTDLIRKMYTAFNAGDIQTLIANIADGAYWHNQGPAVVPYAGLYNGKEEIVRFFQTMAETIEGGEVVPESFVAQGDRVVALGRYRATVRSTGSKIDCAIAHDFTLRDGKVTRWEGYGDTAAVAAAHTVKAATA